MIKKDMKLIYRNSHILRVTVGVWLLYLVYQMKDILKIEFGMEFIISVFFMALFVLIAIFLLVKSGLKLYRGEYIDGKKKLKKHTNEKTDKITKKNIEQNKEELLGKHDK